MNMLTNHTARPASRSSHPWLTAHVVYATLLILTLALTLLFVVTIRPLLDPQAQAQAAAEAQRQAQIAAAIQPIDVLITALWRFVPLVLLVASATVGLGIVWRRWGWRESIGAHYLIEAERAKNPPLPVTLRNLTIHQGRSERPTAAGLLRPLLEEPESIEQNTPSFANLLAAGQVGRDAQGRAQALILGYHAGQPITGDWRSLYSSGLGGLQGSGKSWTATYLLSQSALAGAKLVVCDPHAGDEESLAARVQALAPAFLCDIAEDEKSIMNALKYADSILQKRKQGDPDRTPVIVAVDEWSALRRGELAEVLPQFVENFSTEGRKLQCHAMLLGQRWDKASVGDFRNTLASSYIHRMRTDEARMMTGLRGNALPADTLQLAPGTAYLLDTRGTLTRVQIPLMTPEDVQAVGSKLTAKATNDGDAMTTSTRPMGFHMAAKSPENRHKIAIETPAATHDYSASESQIVKTPEEARIIELFLSGKDASAIVTELTGMTSKAGKSYMAKLTEVQAVIREALRKKI